MRNVLIAHCTLRAALASHTRRLRASCVSPPPQVFYTADGFVSKNTDTMPAELNTLMMSCSGLDMVKPQLQAKLDLEAGKDPNAPKAEEKKEEEKKEEAPAADAEPKKLSMKVRRHGHRMAVLVAPELATWAHQTASEGLRLPSDLGRRGPAPRIPPRGRGPGPRPCPRRRFRSLRLPTQERMAALQKKDSAPEEPKPGSGRAGGGPMGKSGKGKGKKEGPPTLSGRLRNGIGELSHKDKEAGKAGTGLMGLLATTTTHYIRCVKPNDSMAAFGFEQPRVLQQLQCLGRVFTTGPSHRQGHSLGATC
tara:strand:- start:241 stop:1161 length:921 start_codon:yes stop_codon:yes gene_type:complete